MSEIGDMEYIASCSFGKDSIATILLALEHNEPLDRAVFVEVMFDLERNISGEHPEHIEWIYSDAIPKLQSMGVVVDIVRGERDYAYYFREAIKRKGKNIGKLCGFPIAGRCFINRDCKVRPIKRYLKNLSPYVEYIGIAKDEPLRLRKLDGVNRISLLDKYGYTEDMAKAKAESYGLLSPIYKYSNRNGCWFCPNCSYRQFESLRSMRPDLWNELLSLSKTPNLCSTSFKWGKTVEEVTAIMDWNKKQQLLF